MKKREINRFIAGFLSFILPGIGEICYNKYKLGAFWIAFNLMLNVVWFFAIYSRTAVIFTVTLYLAIRIFSTAYVLTHGYRNDRVIGKFNKWYQVAVIFIVILAVDLGISQIIDYYRSPALVRISGDSMSPIIEDNYQVMADRAYFRHNPIQRGDLAHITDEDDASYSIKRIVGLPGERIEVIDGVVYINGDKSIDIWGWDAEKTDLQPWMLNRLLNHPKITIEEDHYFVLGDNRLNSFDSRLMGTIHRDNITEKALYIFFPLSVRSKAF